MRKAPLLLLVLLVFGSTAACGQEGDDTDDLLSATAISEGVVLRVDAGVVDEHVHGHAVGRTYRQALRERLELS